MVRVWKGGPVAPVVEPFPLSEPAVLSCEACPDGVRLSLTVFFNGIGDKDATPGAVSRAERRFPAELAERMSKRRGQQCCIDEIFVITHDPELSIRENAAIVADILRLILRNRAATWPLLAANLHLQGFSAGGLLAVEVACQMDTSNLPTMPLWCGQPKTAAAPVQMDLVTIATPFDFEWDFGIADLLSTLGVEFGFLGSIGAGDYGSDTPPADLCAFTALVTSSDLGDESFGAGNDPRDDDQLPGWFKPDSVIPRTAVVDLTERWPGEQVSHLGVLERVLADPGVLAALSAGCSCASPPR